MKKSDKTSRSYRKSIVNSIARKLFRNSSRGLESLEPRQMLSGVALTNVAASEFIANGENSFTVEAVSSEFPTGGEKVYTGFAFYTESGEQVEGFRISKISDKAGNDVTDKLIDPNATIQKLISYNVAELDLNQQYTMQVEWTGNGDAPKFAVAAYMMGDLSSFANYQYGYATASMNGDALNNSLSAYVSQEELAYAMASRFSGVSTNWNGTIGTFNGYTISRNAAPLKSFVLSTDRKVDGIDVERIEQNAKLGYVDFQISFDSEAPIAYIQGNTGVGSFDSADKTFDIYANDAKPTIETLIQDEKQLASVILNVAGTDKGDLMTLETLPAGVTKMDDISGDSVDYNNIARFNIDLAALFELAEAGLEDGSSHTFTLTVSDAMKNTATYTYNITYQSDNAYKAPMATSIGEIGGEAILFSNVTDGSQPIVIDPSFTKADGSDPVNGETTRQRICLYTYPATGGTSNGTYVTKDFVPFTYNSETGKWTHSELTLNDFFQVGSDGAITEKSLASALNTNSDSKIDDGVYLMSFALSDQYGHTTQPIGHDETSAGAGDATNVVTMTIDTTAPTIKEIAFGADVESPFFVKDANTADVKVTLNAADLTDVSVSVLRNQSGATAVTSVITVGGTDSTLQINDFAYGKNTYTVTVTDKAGNTTSQTFDLYSNTTPEAIAITATGTERQTSAIAATEAIALDFAAAVSDATDESADADMTVKILASSVENGALYKSEGTAFTALTADADGNYSFAASDSIYFLPTQYWFGSEAFDYTVYDNGDNFVLNASSSVAITVAAQDTTPVITWTQPTAVDEDSTAADQILGTFSYPTNEARTWSAAWTANGTVVNKLNAGNDSAATSLFTTNPAFTVVADGDPVNGIQNYKIVMSGWALGANLWGTQNFDLTVTGAKPAELTLTGNVTAATADDLVFTVNSVNDLPVAGTQKQFNVSLSGLAKNNVTLTFDDAMFSDIDDAYANLTISSATLVCGDNTITLAQGETKTLAVNGVNTEFKLDGKTIVVTQNDSEALDKGIVNISYTVSDSQTPAGVSAAITDSSIKFSAYASDDEVTMNEDGDTVKFNVLVNDRGDNIGVTSPEYVNWGNKTFEISQVNGDAISESGTVVDLYVGSVKAGFLTLLSKSSISADTPNFSFKPEANWNGTVSFEYTITNYSETVPESATATVTITVNPINDYPTFAWSNSVTPDETDVNKASKTIDEDSAASSIILGSYADIDSAVTALNAALASNRVVSQYGTISGTAPTTAADSSLFSAWTLSVNEEFQLVFSYTLAENAYGLATIAFTPTDEATAGSQGTAPVAHTFTLTVNPVNDAPIANDKTVDILEDADYTEVTLEFGIDKDVYDVESSKSNLRLHLSAPTNGKLYVRSGEEGLYVYTEFSSDDFSAWWPPETKIFYKPNANYFGTEAISYQIKDSGVDAGLATPTNDATSELATFTFNITAVNDAPVITPNTTDFTLNGSVYEKSISEVASDTLNSVVLGTVTDVDTALANITVSMQTVDAKGKFLAADDYTTNPQNLFAEAPTFAINGSGELVMSYKLAAHVNGYANISVQVNDGSAENNLSSQFDYKLTVAPVNDNPVAQDATWNISIGAVEKVVSETASTHISYGFVQDGKISDIDGDKIGAYIVSADGYSAKVYYGNEVASDVTANLTFGGGKLSTCTITFGTGVDAKTIVLALSVNDELTVMTISGVTSGADYLEKLDKCSLVFNYYAKEMTTDPKLSSESKTFTIKFSAYTQDDDASYDQVAVAADHVIDVLDNDDDNWAGKTFAITAINGTAVTAGDTLVTVAGGTIQLNADGTIKYTQAVDYRGTFTFTYTITEVGGTETADGTVTVLVKAINAAPTAGQVDATIAESQAGDDKIQLNFAAGVADRETADADLTITIAESAVANGTLVDSEGNALVATDGNYSFAATASVYFKPTQYYNGTVTIPYTVTDRLDDLSTYTLVDGQTVKTATNNAVVIVSAVTSEPIVEWNGTNSYTVKEDNEGFALTEDMVLGTVKFPKNESVSLILSANGDNGNLFDNPVGFKMFKLSSEPTEDGLYNVWTVFMNKDYTLAANAYGTCNFTLQVQIDDTNKGVSKSFAFTVNPVNDMPTVPTAATGSGAVEDPITLDFNATDVETSADNLVYTIATLPANGSLYKNGSATAMAVNDTFKKTDVITYKANTGLADTVKSDTFTYTVTDSGINAGLTAEDSKTTDAQTATIAFNAAPVLSDYSGMKQVNTSTQAQTDNWTLFSLDQVTDPEGKAIYNSLITVDPASGATWDGDNLVLSYNFAQGEFASKSVTVTIADPVDARITNSYTFTVVAVNTVNIPLATSGTSVGQKDFETGKTYYYDFAGNIVEGESASAPSHDLNSLFGTTGIDSAEDITVFYNFSAGDDYQYTDNASGALKFWTADASGSNIGTTETAYPLYLEGSSGIQAKDINGNRLYWQITPDSTNTKVVSDSWSGNDTPVMIRPDASKAAPVTTNVVDGKLQIIVSPYASTQATTGAIEITHNGQTISIPVTTASTYKMEWFVTDLTGSGNLKRPNGSSKSYSTSQWFGEKDQSSDLKVNNNIGATDYHYLELFATDNWTSKMTDGENRTYIYVITIDFGAPVNIDPNTDTGFYELYTGGDLYFGSWDSTNTIYTVAYFAEESASTTAAYKDNFIRIAELGYAYTAETSASPIVSISNVMRLDMGVLNDSQYSATWASGAAPATSLYGTESADLTVVEGTGVYMQLTTDAPTAQTADQLPQSETWINEWQSHYVNLYANTQDATIIDGRLSFALNYDPAYFTATDFVAGDALFGGQIEYVDGKAYVTGLVDSLDAADGFVLLGSVKFESLDGNGVAANTVGSVDMGLSLSNIVLNDAEGDQIAVNTQTVVDTRLWAVVYDADDSGDINMADFISFASYFNTNTIVSNDATAWALDFDKSGSVDMTDFIKFAENFNASRANGAKVNFADGFVQEYIGTKLVSEGDTNLRELVEQAVDEWETKLGMELDVSIQLKVVDYNDKQLGSSYIVDLAENGTPVTGVITLDSDAAGLRWSISDNEVIMSASGEDMYDLYTVILHEIGHLLGYTDQYSAFNEVTKNDSAIVNGHNVTDSSDLMYTTIEPGERKNVSSENAQYIKDAYDYAAEKGATLTYEGTSDLAAAMTGTVSASATAPSVAIVTGMVSESAWTETVTAKVTEEIVRIENEVRENLFVESTQNVEKADPETVASSDFVQNLAGIASEDDDLFADLSWLDDQPSDKTDADNQSQYPFGEIE